MWDRFCDNIRKSDPTVWWLVNETLWYCRTPVRWIQTAVFGQGVSFREGAAENFQMPATLLGAIILQGFALVFSEQSKGVRPTALLIFLGFAVVTIGCFVGLLTSETHIAGRRYHLFGKNTFRFTRWSFGASVLIAFVMLTLGWQESLPGQEPREKNLEMASLVKHTFKKEVDGGKEGVKVSFVYSPIESPNHPKDGADSVIVKFSNGLQKELKIVTVEGYVKTAGSPEMDEPPALPYTPDQNDKEVVVLLRGMKPDASYNLVFYLRPRSKDVNLDAAIREIANDAALSVVVRAKNK